MYFKLVEELQHTLHLPAIVEYITELPELMKLQQKLEKYLEQKAHGSHCSS